MCAFECVCVDVCMCAFECVCAFVYVNAYGRMRVTCDTCTVFAMYLHSTRHTRCTMSLFWSSSGQVWSSMIKSGQVWSSSGQVLANPTYHGPMY